MFFDLNFHYKIATVIFLHFNMTGFGRFFFFLRQVRLLLYHPRNYDIIEKGEMSRIYIYFSLLSPPTHDYLKDR